MFAMSAGKIKVPETHVHLARKRRGSLEAFICSSEIERSISGDLGKTPKLGLKKKGILASGRYERILHYRYTDRKWDDLASMALESLPGRGASIEYSQMRDVLSDYQGASGRYCHLEFKTSVEPDQLIKFFEELNPFKESAVQL